MFPAVRNYIGEDLRRLDSNRSTTIVTWIRSSTMERRDRNETSWSIGERKESNGKANELLRLVGCFFVWRCFVIGSGRADYNCKCYHKARLMPAGEEMNWHVGVKLRAESAGGPQDERRVGECCEWFGRITSRPSGPTRSLSYAWH